MRWAVLLLAAAAAAPEPVAFPKAAEARDPSGRFAVVRVPSEGGAAGAAAQLWLKDLKTGASKRLLSLGRAAIVYWAPGGDSVAVTDRRSAEVSTVLLFRPDKPGEVDLAAELAKTLGPLPEQTENRNVHLEVVRWLGTTKLRLRLRGFGERDPDGFDELFDYELGGRFRRPAF